MNIVSPPNASRVELKTDTEKLSTGVQCALNNTQPTPQFSLKTYPCYEL